jgi:LPXTG-motif cell wall-anchored protein
MNVDQEDKFNIHNSWFILIGGLICLVLLLIVFFKRKVNHRGELSQNVLELLNLWLSKPGYLLELSELNDLVNYDNPAPDTIKKRRENLIRIFALEVSKVYQIPLNKLYDTIPHPSDKRMKLLRLSNNLVQRIKKVN